MSDLITEDIECILKAETITEMLKNEGEEYPFMGDFERIKKKV